MRADPCGVPADACTARGKKALCVHLYIGYIKTTSNVLNDVSMNAFIKSDARIRIELLRTVCETWRGYPRTLSVKTPALNACPWREERKLPKHQEQGQGHTMARATSGPRLHQNQGQGHIRTRAKSELGPRPHQGHIRTRAKATPEPGPPLGPGALARLNVFHTYNTNKA